MGPILLGRLSAEAVEPCSLWTASRCRIATAYSTASSRSPCIAGHRFLWPARTLGAASPSYRCGRTDPRNARTSRPSPWRIVSASGPAELWAPLSSHPRLPDWKRRYKQQGPLAPRALPRFVATPDPSATRPPSIDFPV